MDPSTAGADFGNLVRLAEIAKLNLKPAQLDVLAEMNAFNIEGRYPDSLSAPPEKKTLRDIFTRPKRYFNG